MNTNCKVLVALDNPLLNYFLCVNYLFRSHAVTVLQLASPQCLAQTVDEDRALYVRVREQGNKTRLRRLCLSCRLRTGIPLLLMPSTACRICHCVCHSCLFCRKQGGFLLPAVPPSTQSNRGGPTRKSAKGGWTPEQVSLLLFASAEVRRATTQGQRLYTFICPPACDAGRAAAESCASSWWQKLEASR